MNKLFLMGTIYPPCKYGCSHDRGFIASFSVLVIISEMGAFKD